MGVKKAIIASGSVQNPIMSALESKKLYSDLMMQGVESEESFVGDLYQRFPVSISKGKGCKVLGYQ